MLKFDNRLLFLILVLGMLTVILSCSQTDDITASKSVTKVWLTADRLPTPIPGMTYELWASMVEVTEIDDLSEVQSAGQFSFMSSDTLVTFLEPKPDSLGDPVVRADSNLFVFEGDLFDYSYLFVTIEDTATTDSLPGPIMLMQPVTGNTDTLKLLFPEHYLLGDAIIRCNFETPTDGHRWADGYGLWFSAYNSYTLVIHDTLSVEISYVNVTIDPLYDDTGAILNLATLWGEYPDSVWVDYDTFLVDFGRDTLALDIDTFWHKSAVQDITYKIDSTRDPITNEPISRVVKEFDIPCDTVVTGVRLDVFTQDMYALPDLSAYGWRYKGWVVLDGPSGIDPAALGEFTPPAWDFISGELLIPGYEGGLLTTGTFSNVEEPDDSNPFTLEIEWEVDSGSFMDTVLKRPAIPGEDFLNAAALSAATNGVITSPVDLLPYGDNSGYGSVFISIEPYNMVTDTTNFPLIPFCRALPPTWPLPPEYQPGLWTLLPWTGTAPGAKGFPVIIAEIKRL